MTDREQALIIALRSIDLSIVMYLDRLRRGETTLGTPYLVLGAIHEDVRRALAAASLSRSEAELHAMGAALALDLLPEPRVAEKKSRGAS